jgi:hypothetical protein
MVQHVFKNVAEVENRLEQLGLTQQLLLDPIRRGFLRG